MRDMKRATRVRGEKGESTLKRILRYVGRYPLSLACSLLCAAISVAATLFVPVLFGDAIDCIVGKNAVDFDTVWALFVRAAVIIAIIPLILIYPLLQKYFVKGIMVGAIKE